jgi:hypothetical protein
MSRNAAKRITSLVITMLLIELWSRYGHMVITTRACNNKGMYCVSGLCWSLIIVSDAEVFMLSLLRMFNGLVETLVFDASNEVSGGCLC